MNKKTLIIHGSPRPSGDTAYLIQVLKKELTGEVVEISAYRSHITPCLDCRRCLETGLCPLHDDMDMVFADDYDSVVLASPVYYGTLPGPVLSMMSRFQVFRSPKCNKKMHEKKAGLILTAGGTGNETHAKPHINILFKMLRAFGHEEHVAASVDTDLLPANEDKEVLEQIKKLAKWLEE